MKYLGQIIDDNDFVNKKYVDDAVPSIPTSLKNPNSLTVKVNESSSFTYDGSVAKTLNIKAGTNVSVSSDTNGNITINSTDTNTDYRVLQTNDTTNADYRVILSTSATDTNETSTVRKSNKITANPSTGELKSTKMTINSHCTLEYDTANECLNFNFS